MKELIEQAKKESAEGIAERVAEELKAAKVRRVHRAGDELYIEAGDDEAAITFDPVKKKAFVRMVITRPAEMTGGAIATVLKKNGML